MLKKRVTAMAVSGSFILAGPLVGSAAAEGVSEPEGVASAAVGEFDRTQADVIHFGYDGTKKFVSPVLDGADPKSHNPANWLPKSLVTQAKSAAAAAAPGLVCTLWVGKVVPNTPGSDKAGTSQDCTGSFRTQWTQAQFATDNGGWHRVTGSIVGPRTSGQHNDTTFYANCQDPLPGDRGHRLEARGYAIAADGVQVSGDLLYGKSFYHRCM
ncbi:hypothetical protein EF912_30830 [Streptomyces sp. WAC07061]|uniref:hypothetical protein n=1 Tax=Streptomyces sp. WAC07061 TaxID=2487410 RepID=UPI000F779054|nr:hypothetical protein [Streptomyces sp. WAC07061]RSS42180.1 hypothetical protein EF912_30830 [Streptomyces sp. WAC07061]